MRKIIISLFIILFCFSIGVAEYQEEGLSNEERAKIEKKIERLKKEKKELHGIFNYLFEKFDSMDKEINQLEMRLQEKDVLDIIIEESKKDIYELMFEESEKQREKEKKKKELSWLEKYRMYPSGEINYLNSLYELYGGGKTEAEKLKEENDRLESLLEDLRSERSSLEWDMMRYRWDLEDAKPDPLDYQIALNSAVASAMIAPNPFYDSWLYPYYPTYSRQTDRANYEPLLFTLCTDSKGKMDWTKYGWLKLLLKNK